MDDSVPPDDDATVGATLPFAPDGDAPAGAQRRWPWVLGAIATVLVLTFIGSLFLPTPYYRLAPGSVRTTESLIEVQGAPSYHDDAGDIGYTTISLGPATAFEVAVGWFDPDIEILSREDAIGDQDPEENRRLNLAAMDVSKNVAVAVALDTLGYDVGFRGDGAQVVEVPEDGPAAAAGVEVGETIVAIDGEVVELSEDVGAAVRSRSPGDVVSLTLEAYRDGEVVMTDTGADPEEAEPAPVRTLEVTLGESPADPVVAFLGVATVTRDPAYELPVDVIIDSGNVGGPSAGLAFTLGVIDVMTPGDLTGGRRVATTGTINAAGQVGPIGGIEQKTAAVIDSGAEIFLVPPREADQATAAASGRVEVIPVATLDEALAALAEQGGDLGPVEQLAGGSAGG